MEQQKGHVVVEPVRATDVAATLTVPGRLTFSEDQTWHVGAIASGRVDGSPRASAIPFTPARSSAVFTVTKCMRPGRGISRQRRNWSGRGRRKPTRNSGATARRGFSI